MAMTRLLAALFALALMPIGSAAGAEHSVGEVIRLVSTFCPAGSVEANGQSLIAADHADLFAVIGTLYGVDGAGTFRVPMLKPIYGNDGGRIMQCIVTVSNPGP
jgi:microcystin-dependent protein